MASESVPSPVFFHPWEGDRYSSEGLPEFGGLRLLLVGDSHYVKPGKTVEPTFTKSVIERLGRDGGHPFFTKAANLALGLGKGRRRPIRQRAFYDRIAFMNFVQDPLIKIGKSRTAPTEEQLARGALALVEVVERLAPHAVLVLSKRCGEKVPEDLAVPHQYVSHPSSSGGWSYDDWMEGTRAFMRRVAEGGALSREA